tara:strand:- start:62 stop:277 length:216 start_codon:yes stop_codon:yes gene_type:complete
MKNYLPKIILDQKNIFNDAKKTQSLAIAQEALENGDLGEVAERSNAAVLKTVVRLRGPGVRIPPSPPKSRG